LTVTARKRSKPKTGTRYRRRKSQQKVCSLCSNQVEKVDYKDTDFLTRYINERGRILRRRRTGTCAKHQRQLAKAIKRARYLALLPYVYNHVRKMNSII
jgi:small subunit ribosomal protein S18